MDAELMVRFQKFPKETQSILTRAIANRAHNDLYKAAVKEMSEDAAQWMVDYWTDHLAPLEAGKVGG